MFLFAHTGIALGAATAVATAVAAAANRREKKSWLASLSKYADIRFLIIGSMLPDIIDKPVGQYFFRETFENGRIFSHTLLFLLLISTIGLIVYKKSHRIWGFSLVAGVLAHLVLDSMWGTLATLFWPLMGWGFGAIDITDYAGMILRELISDPSIYIPETIGLIIIIWSGITVIRKKQIAALLKTGRIS
jgi:inner membrane protein